MHRDWSVQQTTRSTRVSMLYTSEQFANKEVMENHESVAQGVTDRQTRTSSSRSSTDEHLREVSRLNVG